MNVAFTLRQMAHSHWVLALALAALPSACSQSDEPSADLSAALTSAQVETMRYARTCVDDTTLGNMNDQLERHRVTMRDLLDDMESSCAMLREGRTGMMGGRMGMHACQDPFFQDLDARVADLNAAMSEYMGAMHDATLLEQARSACQDHSQHMLDLLSPMLDDLHRMQCGGSP
jgi:hypothetical protein